jgi:hypothetical protein
MNTDISAKVILKKEERRKNTGLSPGPLGLASLSRTSSSHPLPAASEKSCQDIRKEALSSRPLITLNTISYARLSLVSPDAEDYDGSTYDRLAVNLDISFNNNTRFQKYKFRLTNKRSEFYANLPDGWQSDLCYGSAWECFNEQTDARWIGKACYRNDKGRHKKLRMVEFTAMTLWRAGDTFAYRFWIEDAEVAGTFDIEAKSKYYVACSEPVHNFQPTERSIIQL